jgi:short chain dehydrogenase
MNLHHSFVLLACMHHSYRYILFSCITFPSTVDSFIIRSQSAKAFGWNTSPGVHTVSRRVVFSKSIRKMSKASSSETITEERRYTLADQVARFARAKAENNQRYLDITTVYDPSFLKGLRVAITGANRGIGLAIATEIVSAGAELIAIVRSTSPELEALKPAELISGVDVADETTTSKIHQQITGGPIDIVCHNTYTCISLFYNFLCIF